jgi:ABC-type dipeptide/oligopeptide/nickel transport system permease component
MKLIFLTMLIAFAAGIWFGVIDGYRKKDKGSISTMVNLIGLSLPDVFVVIVAQIFIGWAVNSKVFGPFIDIDIVKFFIIPLFCLSIIPTMYVTRIVSTSIREEIKKEYIKAARAKGLSRRQVLVQHILIGVVIKVLDSMPSVLTIIISNMIVVEYLFYYPGIVYNLFSYYKEGDIATFIGLALSLGVIYISFILLIKLVSYLINPVKREGMH